ncbi:hypothetical protein GCM10007977_070840 [Dactylosporangium sucinum]|uniref:N-acetyltransferase domain-containing protein n=1 Tax=Dactylosporangium sucinum TaxID=1424081 RepID=A0A917U566_9ACTN|nr:hypothetical protein GCM10007977_070840 [Dactylosporangium sucinum]
MPEPMTQLQLARLDPGELWRRFGARLSALPPDGYLRCFAFTMAEYRRLYLDDDLPSSERRLVDDIVALTERAAAGEPVAEAAAALDRRWSAATGGDRPYAGPLPIELFKAGQAALWELLDEAHRYDSAEDIGDGALGYEDPRDQLANTRLLLRLLDRVAGGHTPVEPVAASPRPLAVAPLDITPPLTIRRAEPEDVPAVLDLLDESVAWLRGKGLQQWLTWPDDQPATYLTRLAVRRGLAGRGLGAQVLDWARAHAHRHGSRWLRVPAWPGNPRLHGYLRGQGFHPLWTIEAPLAESRTLFAGRSGERLAAVDVQGGAGQEGARHGEEDAVGDLGGGTDATGRVAGTDHVEVGRLGLVAELVPGAGVDHAG